MRVADSLAYVANICQAIYLLRRLALADQEGVMGDDRRGGA
jgi:hypothetical protein